MDPDESINQSIAGRRLTSVLTFVVMMMMMVIVIFFITVIFIKGLLFVEDAALLGTLLSHEFIVYSSLFPRYLLLPWIKPQDQSLLAAPWLL